METLIEFKNRETTAKHGRMPNKLLIFTDFIIDKTELNLVYDSIRYEIGLCSQKNNYDVIKIFINLMLDIEDILQEIKNKYKDTSKYSFKLPLHILEISYVIKSLKDYSDTITGHSMLNALIEKLDSILNQNYGLIKKYFEGFNNTEKEEFLKEIWNNLYDLINPS
jgi:hypothetical protein